MMVVASTPSGLRTTGEVGMSIKQHKVVVSLPVPLEPDSIYYVRNGGGFDIHVTNNSGVVVGYELNVSLDKVDKVVGKQLSDENYTLTEKQKLGGVADEATKNRADSENADKVHTHTVEQVSGLGEALDNKVDTSSVVQTTGQSTTSIMSQKATTDAIANIPSVPKSAAYTVTAADKGASIDTSAGVTIPASVFAMGDVIVVTNTSASSISITPASGVTFRLAGSDSTGVRTLSGYGVATFRMASNNVWFASGAGLS